MIVFPIQVAEESAMMVMLRLQSLMTCARSVAANKDLTVKENTATAESPSKNTGKYLLSYLGGPI